MLAECEVVVGRRPDNPHGTLHVGLGARRCFIRVGGDFDEPGPTLGAGGV